MRLLQPAVAEKEFLEVPLICHMTNHVNTTLVMLMRDFVQFLDML